MLEAQAEDMGDEKTTVAPDGVPSSGQLVRAKSRKTPMSKIRISGLNSSLRTTTYGQTIARYGQEHFNLGTMDASIQAASTTAKRWASNPGYESCEEFATEVFSDLQTVEDLLAMYGPDGIALMHDLAGRSYPADFGKLTWLRGEAGLPPDANYFPRSIPWVEAFESTSLSLPEKVHRGFAKQEKNEPHHWVMGVKDDHLSAAWARNAFLIAPDHWYPNVLGKKCSSTTACRWVGCFPPNAKAGDACTPGSQAYQGCCQCDQPVTTCTDFLPSGYDRPLDSATLLAIQQLREDKSIDVKNMRIADQDYGLSMGVNEMEYSADFLSEAFRLQEEYSRLLKQREEVKAEFNARLGCKMLPFDQWIPQMAGCGDRGTNYGVIQSIALDVLPDLQEIDVQLRTLQEKARKIGCLDEKAPYLPTPCDFSPPLARQSIEMGIREARNYREEIYKICKQTTLQGISLSRMGNMGASRKRYLIPRSDYQFILGQESNGIPRPKGWTANNTAKDKALLSEFWRQNPEAFKAFFKAAVSYSYKVQQEKDAIKAFSNATEDGKRRLGQTASDSGSVETNILGQATGGSYDYTASWMVTDYEKAICQANLKTSFDFGAEAKVFGKTVGKVAFNSEFATHENQSGFDVSMTLDGKEFIKPSAPRAQLSYHFVASETDRDDVMTVSHVVPVLGVPVTLRADLDVYAGYGVDITSKANRSCGLPHFDAMSDLLNMGMNGTMGPYAGLLLTVSGSVDAGIADVGVRGDISLVEVGLPFSINNQIKPRFDYQTALSPNTVLNLRLVTMGGKLTAFFDTAFHDMEVELFSWGGLGQNKELLRLRPEKPDTSYSIKYACDTLNNACR